MDFKKIILWMFCILLLYSCGSRGKISKPENVVLDTISVIRSIAKIEPELGLIELSAGSNGIVKTILVQENDTVKNGAPLILLDDRVVKAQLNQSLSKLSTQKDIIESNKASLKSVELDLEDAQQQFDRNVRLYAGKAQTKSDMDESEKSYKKFLIQKEQTEAQLNQSIDRLKELEADVEYNKSLLTQKTVIAPETGTILSLDIKPGQNVTDGTKIGEFAPSGNLIAITEVDELFASLVKPDMLAVILSQDNNDTIARGRVYYVASYLKSKSIFDENVNEEEDRRVRTVKVRLKDYKDLLINSRVYCIIYLDSSKK